MRAIYITSIGLDAWELNFLQATIDITANDEIGHWQYVTEAARADVALIGDATRSPRTLAAGERALPILAAIVERATARLLDTDLILARPILYKDIVALLHALESSLRIRAESPRVMDPVPAAIPQAELRSDVVVAQAPIRAPTGAPVPSVVPSPKDTRVAEAAVASVSLAPTTAASSAVDVPRPAIRPPVPRDPDSVPPRPAEHELNAARPGAAPSPQPPAAVASPTPPPAAVVAGDAASIEARLAQRARPARRFFEGTRLLGVVRRVLDNGQVMEIHHPSFPTVTLHPALQAYTCPVDPATVPGMFRAPAMEFASREPDTSGSGPRQRLPRLPIARLLYCAAFFGGEGRMPALGDVDDRFELIGAPDFQLYPHSDDAQATVMHLAGSLSEVKDIAAATGISLDTIVDILNALESVGLVRRHPRHQAPEDTASLADSAIRRVVIGAVDRLRTLAKTMRPTDGSP